MIQILKKMFTAKNSDTELFFTHGGAVTYLSVATLQSHVQSYVRTDDVHMTTYRCDWRGQSKGCRWQSRGRRGQPRGRRGEIHTNVEPKRRSEGIGRATERMSIMHLLAWGP